MGKHDSLTCHIPFCTDCWAIIKGNIQGVIRVAEGLRSSDQDGTNTTLNSELAKFTSKAELQAYIRSLVPKDRVYRKLEQCEWCQDYQYRCSCSDAYNQCRDEMLAKLGKG